MLVCCDIKIRRTRVECSHDGHALLKCMQFLVLWINMTSSIQQWKHRNFFHLIK